jgi:hypothetical protein
VAAKNGTLFVQATMPLADPRDYRNEANRCLRRFIGLSVLADADDKGGSTLDSAPSEWDCPEF